MGSLFNKNGIGIYEQNQQQMLDTNNKSGQDNLGKCDNHDCGKDLVSPYYVLYGIPEGPPITVRRKCGSLQDERDKERDFMIHVPYDVIKSYYNRTYHGMDVQGTLGLEEYFIKSKKRICNECWELFQYKENIEMQHEARKKMAAIDFAIEEYKRRHEYEGQESINPEADQYIRSLSNRCNMLKEFLGDWINFKDLEFKLVCYECKLQDHLILAFVGGNKDKEKQCADLTIPFYRVQLQDLRDNFILDKNRKLPNEAELTRWLQNNFENTEGGHDPWFKISHCKIFEDQDFDGTKYIIIVHFSAPKGYWLQFDI